MSRPRDAWAGFHAGLGDSLRSLRIRNYRRWFISQSISLTGFWMQVVAQALLVLDMGGDGTTLGVLAAMQFMPSLLFGAWAGVLSDRIDKRRLLLVTQAVNVAAPLALGVLVLADRAGLGLVVILAGVIGVASAFDQPARRAIVLELVGDEDAASAVSLNGAVGQVAKIVGPVLAGAVIAAVGTGWCFVLNGVSTVAVIVALWRMDLAALRRPSVVERRRGQIQEGVRFAWSNEGVRINLLLIGVVSVMAWNFNVLGPLLVTRDLHGSAGTFAVLMSVMSTGSVAGSVFVARRREASPTFLAGSSLALAGGLAAMAVAPSVPTAGMAAAIVGFSMMMLFNGGVVGIQLGTLPELRGRVMGLFGVVMFGGQALGGPLAGWLAQQYGARSALAFGAVGTVIAGVGTLLLTGRRRSAGLEVEPVVGDGERADLRVVTLGVLPDGARSLSMD